MDRHEVTTRLIQKFTSGNSLQVQRAHITREEFNAIYLAMRDFGVAEAKLARVEALAVEFGALEIRANTAADRNEYPEDHLQNVGRSQAYCDCKQKLREALGEKEVE